MDTKSIINLLDSLIGSESDVQKQRLLILTKGYLEVSISNLQLDEIILNLKKENIKMKLFSEIIETIDKLYKDGRP